MAGVYEETGKGLTGGRLIRPFYRETVDVGLLEKKDNNGRIQGEAMAGL